MTYEPRGRLVRQLVGGHSCACTAHGALARDGGRATALPFEEQKVMRQLRVLRSRSTRLSFARMMPLSLPPEIISMVVAAGAVDVECSAIRACERARMRARIAPRARVPFVFPPRSRLHGVSWSVDRDPSSVRLSV